jgi:hypothetical protein
MFGNAGAFVNGNMFMGLFGADIGVKLPDDARRELLEVEGVGPFGPAERPMGGYVTLPAAWPNDVSGAHRPSAACGRPAPPAFGGVTVWPGCWTRTVSIAASPCCRPTVRYIRSRPAGHRVARRCGRTRMLARRVM